MHFDCCFFLIVALYQGVLFDTTDIYNRFIETCSWKELDVTVGLFVSILDGTAVTVLGLKIDTVMADMSCHSSAVTCHSE